MIEVDWLELEIELQSQEPGRTILLKSPGVKRICELNYKEMNRVNDA